MLAAVPDDCPAAALVVDTSRNVTRGREDKDPQFCYRCGEDGHVSSGCRNNENQSKVIQKLIRSLKKRDQTTNSRSVKETSSNFCSSKQSAVKVNTVHGLPKGLVGPSSVVSVKIN